MAELRDVSVCFKRKGKEMQTVDSVDLTTEEGDVYGIVGYSGAGKSALVRMMNSLQKLVAGEVIVNQANLSQLSPKELRKERKVIGMIFRHLNLMKSQTILDNVDFFLKYSGKSKRERRQKANELLELAGLEEKASAYPKQLSRGQRQRVAIMRAPANEPKVLLCDEVISAPDPRITLQILTLLKKLNRQLGLTIVLITYEIQVVKEICNEVAIMKTGKITEGGSNIQVFSHPEEELAKDFTRTTTYLDQALEAVSAHAAFADQIVNKWLVKLSYISNQTNEPLVVHLHSKYQVTAGILYGNIELLQETPLGSLIVILAGETKQWQKVLGYLIKSGAKVVILQKNGLDNRIRVIEGGS